MHFQMKQLFYFHFCLPSQWGEGGVVVGGRGSTLKGKTLLLLEQILNIKSMPYFGRNKLSKKANRKS